MTMDQAAARRTAELFLRRDQLEAVESGGADAARACLDRARRRLHALDVLVDGEHWETAFTTAYDAYRTAADAIVLLLGYRVPAVKGAHRVPTDIAHVALQADTDAFGPIIADRFRAGRHESEYFDPDRPVDKTEDDARWAQATASAAVGAVATALG